MLAGVLVSARRTLNDSAMPTDTEKVGTSVLSSYPGAHWPRCTDPKIEVTEGDGRNKFETEWCASVAAIRVPGCLDLIRTVKRNHRSVVLFPLTVVGIPDGGLLFLCDGMTVFNSTVSCAEPESSHMSSPQRGQLDTSVAVASSSTCEQA